LGKRTAPKQLFNPIGLAGQQIIHQLIGHPQLQPVALQGASHADPMAAIFGLFGITRRPGTLQ
jgi:hypothetical protein